MPIYSLGDRAPDIDPTAYVHPDAVLIGAVTIGPEATVWPHAVLRADDSAVRVGARTSVQDGSVIHCTRELDTVIGDECVVGHLVHMEGCAIEDRALVGSGSIVLPRAVVRSGALVGAAALVPNGVEVPAGAMALGVPATIKPDSVDPEMIARTVETYVERGRRYRQELGQI